jgi:hypothetical protein
MFLHAHLIRTQLFIALGFVIAGCTNKDQQPPAAPATPAPSLAFPVGSGDRLLSVADCDKLPDPKPADDSAAGRATAVSQGVAARAACKKEVSMWQAVPSSDVTRIREIREKEQADQSARKVSEKEWGKRINEGSGKPIKEYKY